jgi:hypothetical protein
MKRTIILLVIGCLLVAMAGCSSHKNTETSAPIPTAPENQQNMITQTTHQVPSPQKQTSTPVPNVTQQTYSSTAENWPYSSLVLPNGKVITSKDYQPSYWKGLNIQLYTALDANDNSLDLVEDIVGNHTDIVAQDLQPVTLTIGPAILASISTH